MRVIFCSVIALLLGPLNLVLVESFTSSSTITPKAAVTSQRMFTLTRTSIVTFMSDVPQDDTTEEGPAAKKTTKQRRRLAQRQQEDERQVLQRKWRDNNNNNNNNNRNRDESWKEDWWPEPPEDQLTLYGDVASLFLYAFIDHFLNDVFLASIFETSKSAADAAKTLDPSGTDIVLSSTPVWLDPTAVGPHISDQVLFWDLQSRVTPHFTPLFASAGVAAVTLATCWIVAGLFHKAFHFRNTLDCSTHRAVYITGQTWITSSLLLIFLACTWQHLSGAVDTSAMSASVLMMEGRTMSSFEEWFTVMTRSDAEYIFNSLGVVLTWRFLVSFLMGGWSKK